MNWCLLGVFLLWAYGPPLSEGKPRQKRMVQGEPATLKEWPFAVWLVKERKNNSSTSTASNGTNKIFIKYCSGTLIRSRWVLTAAHCVEDIVNETEALTVHTGLVDRELMKNSPKFHYNVTKIFIHSNYVNNDVIPNDDIALIKLHKSVAVNHFSFLRPARFALWKIGHENRKKYRCKAAGWGKSRSFSNVSEMMKESEQPSKHLMKIDVPLLSRDDCIHKFNSSTGNGSLIQDENMFWKKMMCGGSPDPSVGTACLHDSGSPLLCEDFDGNKEVHGIAIAIHGPVVHQTPCTPGKQIIVFMRISYYAVWILDVIKKNKGWTDYDV